jgi:hypothetical protein
VSCLWHGTCIDRYGMCSKRSACFLRMRAGERHTRWEAWKKGQLTMLKRILQFSALALLLVPSAAFADTFNLTGGSWTESSGGSFTLTNGPTTLQTGAMSSFFFFFGASGDTGSVTTSQFSCTDCVKTKETFAFDGLFDPDIFLTGTIADGDVSGAFSAELADNNFFSNSGSIESGYINLNIPSTDPSTPAPEPSTWILLLAGLAMLGTAMFSRKMGWLSQVTEPGTEI